MLRLILDAKLTMEEQQTGHQDSQHVGTSSTTVTVGYRRDHNENE